MKVRPAAEKASQTSINFVALRRNNHFAEKGAFRLECYSEMMVRFEGRFAFMADAKSSSKFGYKALDSDSSLAGNRSYLLHSASI